MNTQTYQPTVLETVDTDDRTLRRIIAMNGRVIQNEGVTSYATVEDGEVVMEYYTDAYEAGVFIDYKKGTYDVDWHTGDTDRLKEAIVSDWAKLVIIINSELK